jgi:hypothetical protein
MATSFPDSFPYPDCLMPPNGDSAADWFPEEERFVNEYMAFSLTAGNFRK